MNAREIAERTVRQWDDHDRFHLVNVDGDDPEPSGVTVARAYIAMCQLAKETEGWLVASVKDGTFRTEAEQNIVIDLGVKLHNATLM